MGTNIETSLKKRTIYFDRVFWQEGFALAGPKELKGKLGDKFDFTLINDKFDQDTFEKAERKMFETALDGLLAKSKKLPIEIDVVLGGDLLNQCVSTSFAMRKSSASFLGLYNACGTYAESMILGAALVDKFLDNAVCVSGSHFSSAERQYRYPLELGVLRSPMTQWTCTGVGCSLLSREKSENAPRIVSATMGRVIDFGIKDVNNMGAAMAPAAYDTLRTHFEDLHLSPSDYDLVVTGDLGLIAVFLGHGENARRFRFDTYGRFGQARQGYSHRPHGARGRRFDKKLRGLRSGALLRKTKNLSGRKRRGLQRNRCKRNSAGQSEKRADEKRAAYRNGRSDESPDRLSGGKHSVNRALYRNLRGKF